MYVNTYVRMYVCTCVIRCMYVFTDCLVRTYTDFSMLGILFVSSFVRCLLTCVAPKIFPIAYNLIKPFLDERTRQKVKVLGCK